MININNALCIYVFSFIMFLFSGNLYATSNPSCDASFVYAMARPLSPQGHKEKIKDLRKSISNYSFSLTDLSLEFVLADIRELNSLISSAKVFRLLVSAINQHVSRILRSSNILVQEAEFSNLLNRNIRYIIKDNQNILVFAKTLTDLKADKYPEVRSATHLLGFEEFWVKHRGRGIIKEEKLSEAIALLRNTLGDGLTYFFLSDVYSSHIKMIQMEHFQSLQIQMKPFHPEHWDVFSAYMKRKLERLEKDL